MSLKKKEIEIFKAAIKCIGKLGVERANAQSIAKELGIAQSGVFYYFPKQEDLFDSLVAYIAQINHEMVSALHESKKPKTSYEHLCLHILGNLQWAAKCPDHVAALLVSIAKTSHNRAMKERVNKLFQVGEDRIYSYLVTGIAEKQFAVKGDIREMAVFIHKTLFGMIINLYYAKGSSRDAAFFAEVLESKLRLLVEPPH